tara:strand:- start:179 stop:355 length:177 start_codon:yes stop_codon:yes gene_type:complete
MYEAIEHWKQYKQEKSNHKGRAMKMTPFLIKLVKQKQAEKQMDNFINKLVVNNGVTNI